jgi:hypothetical protein
MAWQEVIKDSNVWVYEYVANGYRANAIAILLDGHSDRLRHRDELAIVSPPIGLSDADFVQIEAKGRVTALIAPHSGHDLGLALWQARYLAARSYAPTTAIEQLDKLGISFTPLSELTAPDVEFHEVPGTKKGGTIAIVRRGERPVIYLDESIVNWSSLPDNWVAKILFWLTGSAPGLKLNRIYLSLLCSDRQALARTLLDALAGDPAIVPAHGSPLIRSGDACPWTRLVHPCSTAGMVALAAPSPIS